MKSRRLLTFLVYLWFKIKAFKNRPKINNKWFCTALKLGNEANEVIKEDIPDANSKRVYQTSKY